VQNEERDEFYQFFVFIGLLMQYHDKSSDKNKT